MIQPGLERISLLLKNVEFPWKAIHVAGTNGKGSICHIASHLLRRRAIRAGTFTTPHLVDRWDTILINNKPIAERAFLAVENEILRRDAAEKIGASPFEILTATAFTCFNNAKVDVGIVEVGMGGRLDATNILNNQAISVISKIAQDHEEYLGKTLGEIALHKAGILRPNVPYIVNPMNDRSVQYVIDDYAREIGAGPRLIGDTPELRNDLYSKTEWRVYATHQRPFQRDNAVLGIVAVKTVMKDFGNLKSETILEELGKKRSQTIPGRLQEIKVPPVFGTDLSDGKPIILDGGHNLDAAAALKEYVHNSFRMEESDLQKPLKNGWNVNWVVAMTKGKDAEGFLRTILRPGDRIITTSFGPVDGMPWVKPMDPAALLKIAQKVQPGIFGFAVPQVGAFRALCASKAFCQPGRRHVMCGSLYLVGEFFREMRAMPTTMRFWSKSSWNPAQEDMRKMHNQEKARVSDYWRNLNDEAIASDHGPAHTPEYKLRRLNSELQALQQEINSIKIKENLILTPRLSATDPTPINFDGKTWPATDNPPPSSRLFPGKQKELRERVKILRKQADFEPIGSHDVEIGQGEDTSQGPPIRYSNDNPLFANGADSAETRLPKRSIRMHFGETPSEDRRNMKRPSFLAKQKFGAQGVWPERD